ncbi:thiol reductase thioredoxin [Finegoldia magna]|uniref:Thiol reductase thioredoxin n=1 Tax=Finegoldia magna TaxID=1260 RepID=A0A233VZ02_FINMA|nr:thioredoxin family protein [Finegoldia magna]MDU7140561.1 thioredoxin family protein [Finegoldia magna]MDU7143615.1 thioredoxin family protein [Anaerococcus vaginalis]OXZ37639.1 thiol reductase thioredoxin [Finegoldia magna]
MKDNKSKIFLVIGFIAVAILVMVFVKKKPNGTSEVKSNQSEQNVSESSNSSEKKDTSDLNSFKEAYKQVDKEDVLFAGKDAGFEKFFSYDKPVFVNFTWIECAPCKEMAPYIENTFDKFKGKAVVKDVEVNVNNDFASQAGIRVTPTQIFIPLKEDFKFSDKAKSVMDEYFQEVTVNGKKGYIHEGLLKENELEILISDMING